MFSPWIIHASVIRPVLDYIAISLQSRGRIIIGDAQVNFVTSMNHGDFPIDRARGLDQKQTPVSLELFDLRIYRAVPQLLGGQRARAKVETGPPAATNGSTLESTVISKELIQRFLGSHRKQQDDGAPPLGPESTEYLFPNSVLPERRRSSVFRNTRPTARTGVTMALRITWACQR